MNRYTTLSFGNIRDLPHLQLPYESIDSLLGSMQQRKVLVDQVGQLQPDYIRESPYDRQLASEVVQYQEGIKQQLADIAATGDTRAYFNALDQAQNNILRLYKPGGAADVLKQRKEQDIQRRQQIDKFYEKNPMLAEFYKRSTPYGEVGYNAQTGEYNPIQGYGNVFPDVEEKDINDWFNKNQDNIKDTLLQEGVDKKKLDTITSMYDFWQLEGVPKEKLISVFTQLFPQEFKNSIYQRERANRFFNPDMPELDTQQFIQNDKGEYELNMNNPISRMISGYAEAGSRQMLKHDRIKDDNELALEAYKSQLRKKEQEEALNNLIIRTLPSNKPVPKDVEYYISGDKIKKNTNASADILSKKSEVFWQAGGAYAGTGIAYKVASFFDRLFTSNDEVDINNNAELSNVKEHLIAANPQLANADNKTINQAVVAEIERQAEGSIDARYTAGDSKFKKQFDDIFVPVLDKDGKLVNTGNLANFNFMNREGINISGQKFAEDATDKGVTISYKGAVTDVASDLPYGSTVLSVGNDEIYMEPDIRTTYDPNMLINGAYRAMNNAEVANVSHFKYKGNDMQMMFKADGSFTLTDKNSKLSQTLYPVIDESGVLVGLTPNK